ncbi:MAG TPA: antibiotic biosynthesis monooxygenase [Solirubrobacteraceae bacterium]|nr:antibiotic biosynthesis monooxygenase [Solirubrobacteraceae bacterium]
MPSVGRYVKLTAREGKGQELAELMCSVAADLDSTPGCELYLVNRSQHEPDVVWVTELWLSQEALDSSLEALQSDEGKARLAEVMALLAAPPERIELEPLGGVGYLAGGTGSTIVNLEEIDDMAARFGYGHVGEARFAARPLKTARTGISHQRLRPGARQAFGHRHHHAEEVYVVLAGSGRVRIDGAVTELRTLDAIRIAPESMRAFEAGPEGMDVLVVGPRHPGDGEIAADYWPA